jgi:hypothetical protein
VTVTLNRAVPEGEWAIIAYAVRDVELISGLPLCVGFVGMTSGDGTTETRENSFELVCEDGKVAGRATSSLYGMEEWDRSSDERRTGIYVQHVEGIKTFMGITIGIEGVKSNRITVSCPRDVIFTATERRRYVPFCLARAEILYLNQYHKEVLI